VKNYFTDTKSYFLTEIYAFYKEIITKISRKNDNFL